MADDTTYNTPPAASQSGLDNIDWLEHWPTKIELGDPTSKEMYKGLVRVYLNSWLSLYNSHPSRAQKQKYEIKTFGENPTGPTAFRPFVLLTPGVERRIEVDENGTPRTHLIPPEPPPPPKDDEI